MAGLNHQAYGALDLARSFQSICVHQTLARYPRKPDLSPFDTYVGNGHKTGLMRCDRLTETRFSLG